MEKIISEKEHIIPINRVIRLQDEKNVIDINYPSHARITKPIGFEQVFKLSSKDGCPCVTIPKKVGNRGLKTNTIKLKIWQNVEPKPNQPKTPQETPKIQNPTTPEDKPKLKIVETLKNLSLVKDYQEQALKKSQEREEKIAIKRDEVRESVALKPVGMDGMRIMTADDCDYSRGVAIIQNLITALNYHNKDIKEINRKKLLCEYYDRISFAGASTIIGLYVALGEKAMDNGNLESFLRWYQLEFSKVYSPTSKGEMMAKGKKFVQGINPFKASKSLNAGLTLKNVKKIVGELFTNKNTGEPFRMKDLHCEVYQPLFLDDERTYVYSKETTGNAKLVDVVINTALDPNYFQTRKIEEVKGISLGPVRRSFDLPIAQHNNDIELVSFGAELTYQETEEELEGITPAQTSFLNKRKNYRIDYEDTKKYMKDNSHKIKYMRIESPQLPEVSENSVAREDMIRCRKSAAKSTFWTNGNKTALTWSKND